MWFSGSLTTVNRAFSASYSFSLGVLQERKSFVATWRITEPEQCKTKQVSYQISLQLCKSQCPMLKVCPSPYCILPSVPAYRGDSSIVRFKFLCASEDDAACCRRLHPRLCLKSKTALMFSSSFPNVIRGWPVGDVLPPQSIVFGRLLSARTDEDRRLGGWRRPADVAAATATPHPS